MTDTSGWQKTIFRRPNVFDIPLVFEMRSLANNMESPRKGKKSTLQSSIFLRTTISDLSSKAFTKVIYYVKYASCSRARNDYETKLGLMARFKWNLVALEGPYKNDRLSIVDWSSTAKIGRLVSENWNNKKRSIAAKLEIEIGSAYWKEKKVTKVAFGG